MFKKGQSASGAASLVLLIGGFIVLYLLLVPPDVRDALLNDQPLPANYMGTTTQGNVYGSQAGLPLSINKTILSEVPGRVDYLQDSILEHPLSAVNLYTTTNAQLLTQQGSVYTKNGVFDHASANVSFQLQDVQNTENVLLSFGVQVAKGRLQIMINDQLVYEGVPNANTALEIDKSILKPINNIVFSVTPVGWQFWTTNEYQLQNVKITADVTDISEQLSKTSFSVTDAEKLNMEKASFRFFPDCTVSQVSKLKITLNNEIIYNSIPDCNQVNILEFSSEVLTSGNNYLQFKTDKGYYSIYQLLVKVELKKQIFPTYYFDMDQRLFTSFSEEDKKCGAIDGYCPANCNEALDRDCCFQGGSKYWCDAATANEGDRCTSVITLDQCSRCSTNYEDKDNNPPKVCKALCGDDTDGICPVGCSQNYDKDCCFVISKKNYWCNDVPVYGITDACKSSLTQAQCNDCPSGYETKEGSFSCDAEQKDTTAQIRNDFDVLLTLKFLNDGQQKILKVFVNGHKFTVNTAKEVYTKNIDQFLEQDSNVIRVEPESGSVDVRKLEVKIEKAK